MTWFMCARMCVWVRGYLIMWEWRNLGNKKALRDAKETQQAQYIDIGWCMVDGKDNSK